MRLTIRILSVVAALIFGLGSSSDRVEAQKLWDATGVSVAPRPPASPFRPIVLGVNGGAFVAWRDRREHQTNDGDAYAQRLLQTGSVAPGWPAGGLALSTATQDQSPLAMVPDGSGGALVFWEDRRAVGMTTGVDIYGQRLTADGSLAPGWSADGNPLTMATRHDILSSASGELDPPLAIPDGSGGAIVTWLGHVGSNPGIRDVYAQRITGAGTIAPGWPMDGVPVCTIPGDQGAPQIVTDGAGGAIIVWEDERAGTEAVEIYAARLLVDGTLAPGWSPDGTLVVDAPGRQFRPVLVPDDVGGAFVVFQDLRTAPPIPDPYDYYDIYVTRVTGLGASAAGWTPGGFPVTTTPGPQDFVVACGDGAGGLYVAWTNQDLALGRVLRISGEGTPAPGWPAGGKTFAVPTGGQYLQDVVSDEVGGAYLVWNNYGSLTEVHAQRITPTGDPAVGWPADGLPMVGLLGRQQQGPTVSPDGLGGAIVAWEDLEPFNYRGIYAQRLGPGGPTPVQVSLVSAEAEAGVVRLSWYAPQGPGITAGVERRNATSEWERLGAPDISGDGTLRYEDRTVSPGGRYAYRLGYSDGTGIGYTSESWVDVPASARFALRGITPNPSAGDAMVALSLVGREAAALEVYDIGGRLISVREVGSLGAGSHGVRLSERAGLAAGVYTVRLREGAQIATTRAVIVR